MKRRTLLQGIGASTAMAVGASASASAANTTSKTGGATHFSVRDDGTRRLVPLDVLQNGIHGLDVDPADACTAPCCYECTCRHCFCQLCCGDPGSSC